MFASLVREAALDALALLVPTDCAGCGAADRSVCAACRAAVLPQVRSTTVCDGLGPLRVWYALDYAGPAGRMIVGLKDGGRTGVARALAPALQAAVSAALAHAGPGAPLDLAAIPSSRTAFRRRGYRHVPLLLAAAGYRAAPVLSGVRTVQDQASLGVVARAANRSGSMSARRADGRAFLIVDDILTTGATVLDARRAIHAGGGTAVAAVAIAHTQRIHPVPHPGAQSPADTEGSS